MVFQSHPFQSKLHLSAEIWAQFPPLNPCSTHWTSLTMRKRSHSTVIHSLKSEVRILMLLVSLNSPKQIALTQAIYKTGIMSDQCHRLVGMIKEIRRCYYWIIVVGTWAKDQKALCILQKHAETMNKGKWAGRQIKVVSCMQPFCRASTVPLWKMLVMYIFQNFVLLRQLFSSYNRRKIGLLSKGDFFSLMSACAVALDISHPAWHFVLFQNCSLLQPKITCCSGWGLDCVVNVLMFTLQ